MIKNILIALTERMMNLTRYAIVSLAKAVGLTIYK